jgi:exopolyphosphatase/guanosine-5'-triphosphate,3'-diphosphate pyrophosphatase
MAERHFHNDPPSAAQIEACFADVRAILADVARAIDVARAHTVVGLAGTITALAALHKGLKVYEPAQTHRARLTRDQVEVLFAQLAREDVAGRRRLLAEAKRAEVILGGAAVLLTLLRELGIEELMVSEADILDGLAASLREPAP